MSRNFLMASTRASCCSPADLAPDQVLHFLSLGHSDAKFVNGTFFSCANWATVS